MFYECAHHGKKRKREKTGANLSAPSMLRTREYFATAARKEAIKVKRDRRSMYLGINKILRRLSSGRSIVGSRETTATIANFRSTVTIDFLSFVLSFLTIFRQDFLATKEKRRRKNAREPTIFRKPFPTDRILSFLSLRRKSNVN